VSQEIEITAVSSQTMDADKSPLRRGFSPSSVGDSFGPMGCGCREVSAFHRSQRAESAVAVILRERGPSNSARKTPCQVPNLGRPACTGIDSEQPTRMLRRWAAVFPSACRSSGSLQGTIFSKRNRRSRQTSGSAFSFTTSPQVVCGTNRCSTPLSNPSVAMACCTESLIGTSA